MPSWSLAIFIAPEMTWQVSRIVIPYPPEVKTRQVSFSPISSTLLNPAQSSQSSIQSVVSFVTKTGRSWHRALIAQMAAVGRAFHNNTRGKQHILILLRL
jgi:hypothetical protein